MDEIIAKKLEQKIQDTMSSNTQIQELTKSLSVNDSKSFVLGIMVGRLYNAFYYQSKRIHDREPTKDEFNEFLDFLKSKSDSLLVSLE